MATQGGVAFLSKKAIAFIKRLFGQVDDVKKTRGPYASLVALAFADIIEHFEEETGPKNTWPEWSSRYQLRLKRMGKSGNQKLQDTGRLRQGFLPGNWRNKKGGLLLFNPVIYAKVNDLGAPKKNIPQRQFMYLSDKGMDKVRNVTTKFLGKK